MTGRTVAVIPFKNRWEMTESLVRGLLAGEPDGEPDAVLLFDNGSSASTRTYATAFAADNAAVRVIDAAGWGIHRMWNAGAELACALGGTVNVAILNNDLIVGLGFLHGLTCALRIADGPVAVCPNYDGRPMVDGPLRLTGICEGRYDGTGGLSGFAFMVRGEWFSAGWRFPEDARWWYGDTLLALSIDVAGGWYAMATDVPLEHIGGGGQTGRWADPDVVHQIRHDREVYIRHARDDLGIAVHPAPITAAVLVSPLSEAPMHAAPAPERPQS